MRIDLREFLPVVQPARSEDSREFVMIGGSAHCPAKR